MAIKFKIWGRCRQFTTVLFMCIFVANNAAANEKGSEGRHEIGNQLNVKNRQDTSEVYKVPPPLVYQGLYPCQACHRKDIRGVNSQLEKVDAFLSKYIRVPNPEPRILVRMHGDVRLKHADWHWCLNCHSTYERNHLKLITGENISFDQSYRLCGQCHGSIFRDWKIGIHGRRVGQWNGKKLYLLCAHCHDPHKPQFRRLPGKAAPKQPEYGRWEEAESYDDAHSFHK
jgi:hypothetical protein